MATELLKEHLDEVMGETPKNYGTRSFVHVSPLDIALIENLQLKAQKLQAELELMQVHISAKVGERTQLQSQMAHRREEILQKYGVDLATCTINPDGSVISNQTKERL